jgi:alanine racemase
MSRGKFEVDTALLRSGSDSSGFAGAAARKAASRLTEASLPQGIFGHFAAAESFHSAVSTARDSHVQRAQDHDARLSDISSKGHIGARAMADTDAGAAEAIGSAGDQVVEGGS